MDLLRVHRSGGSGHDAPLIGGTGMGLLLLLLLLLLLMLMLLMMMRAREGRLVLRQMGR